MRGAAGGRPAPYWRRRRQVRGVWGAGAPQEGQPPRVIIPTCAGGWVLLALPHMGGRDPPTMAPQALGAPGELAPPRVEFIRPGPGGNWL